MATNWLNSDGLYVRFGINEGVTGKLGQYSYPKDGSLQVSEFQITLASLATGSTILSDTVTIPNGARIEKVQYVVVTAATGTGAVLNVGLIDQDRSTAFDADGILEAVILTSLDVANEQAEVTVPAAGGAGALVGTTLTNTGLIVADYDTAAFTAGVVNVKVYFRMIS